MHLYDLFNPYTASSIHKEIYYHKVQNKNYIAWTFLTLVMPYFYYYDKLFYKNKVKIIPSNINII
jgi:hypothetical protein